MTQVALTGDAFATAIFDLAGAHVKLRLRCGRCRRTLDVLDFGGMPPSVRSTNLYFAVRVAADPDRFREPWPSIRKERFDDGTPSDRYTCHGRCGSIYTLAQRDLGERAVAEALAGETELYVVASRAPSQSVVLVAGSRFDVVRSSGRQTRRRS